MRIAASLILLASILNCAKVGFSKGEASSSSVTANEDGSVNGMITGGGVDGTNGGVTAGGVPSAGGTAGGASGSTPAALLPKLQFLAGACPHGALCAIEFRLDKPYAKATQLDWHTNDSLYLTPHFPLYAQPNVHYRITSGRVIFMPGETSKTVYVQNINPNDFEVIIGVLISNCSYDSAGESCAKFFTNL